MSWAERTRERGLAAVRVGQFGACALAAAALLAACQRDAPTELGPDTAAPAAAPAPVAETSAPSRVTSAAATAADAITGDDIRRVVAEIADDRYAGRAPGSAGDKLARAYLAKELEALGFAPGAADGTWEQPVELVGVTTNAPAKWRFTRGDTSGTFSELRIPGG